MIRKATIEDLSRMESCARAFYGSSQFLKEFDLDRFKTLWTKFLTEGTGTIFILDVESEIWGAIGGVIYPDTYSSRLIGTEFFWWVSPDHRGHGIHLYDAFEEWVRSKGAWEIRMVRLCDLMPEKLDWLYRDLGFLPAEVHYVKELT